MVSGFFTSPKDQDLIISGDAKPIRSASNSSTPPWAFNKLSKSFTIFPHSFLKPAIEAELRSNPQGSTTQGNYSVSNSMLIPKDLISLTNTLKDSGIPGSILKSPSTIFLYILVRPFTSSDLTVSISCKV